MVKTTLAQVAFEFALSLDPQREAAQAAEDECLLVLYPHIVMVLVFFEAAEGDITPLPPTELLVSFSRARYERLGLLKTAKVAWGEKRVDDALALERQYRAAVEEEARLLDAIRGWMSLLRVLPQNSGREKLYQAFDNFSAAWQQRHNAQMLIFAAWERHRALKAAEDASSAE